MPLLHRDIDRSRVAAGYAVASLISETIHADEPLGRLVDERAVGVEGQGSMRRFRHDLRGQQVAIAVGVIGEPCQARVRAALSPST